MNDEIAEYVAENAGHSAAEYNTFKNYREMFKEDTLGQTKWTIIVK